MTDENTVAAALYWFDCVCQGEKMAYLYAVATDNAYRGRGLCRALMADTHTHLENLGYSGAILVPATEELQQMYGKMGYLPGTRVTEWTCLPGDEPVELQVLSGEDYERRRRELLPPGGVLQEGAMTALLGDQCVLLGGQGFLLAGWLKDGVLHSEELLGDPAKGPGILKSLGAEKGIFRMPGEETLFSMYCPLTGKCPTPGYFGIAFG